MLEWELQNGGGGSGSDTTAPASVQKTKHAHAKWKKAQRYGNDTGRDEDLETAIDELAEKRDATKVHALQKVGARDWAGASYSTSAGCKR